MIQPTTKFIHPLAKFCTTLAIFVFTQPSVNFIYVYLEDTSNADDMFKCDENVIILCI